MTWIVYLFSAILGSIIGSFLNVVILRIGTGKYLGGRSGCMSCGYQLRWFDLIPVFSWLWVKGKCRQCYSKISRQYPLVELLTAAVFALLAGKFLVPHDFILMNSAEMIKILAIFAWHAVIFSGLIVVFVYDLKHKIIPDGLSYGFAVMAFLQAVAIFFQEPSHNTESFLNLFAGVIFFIPFYLLWKLSDGRLIGLGDGKLSLGIAWYLGFVAGLSAIVLAFWIGAIVAVAVLLMDRLNKADHHITMKTEIPFAPFLILGIFVHFFWSLDLLNIGLFF